MSEYEVVKTREVIGAASNKRRIPKKLWWRISIALITLICVNFIPWGWKLHQSGNFRLTTLSPATAQIIKPQDMWRQVYQRLPNFPLENQYVSKETGKVNPDNTLAGRLIRYHLYIKSRTPNYRLDWKLTLADYLGANERLEESIYPGYDSLTQNPMVGDRTAIARLDKTQRDALVQVLVNLFNPNYEKISAPTPTPSTRNSPQRAETSNQQPRTPALPKPGDAQLLKL